MAASEKVCEYSGEYPSWLMYGYKRNSIQIMPKYRKLFRGATAVLYVKKSPCVFHLYSTGGYSSYCPMDFKIASEEGWTLARNLKEYSQENKFPRSTRICSQWDYVLHVLDENLQGEVQGLYANSTFDIRTTRKKIKRLLGCKQLIVKELKDNFWDDKY
jgi:hypothetical protein